MPLKTEAICTVNAGIEAFNMAQLGYRKVLNAGDTVRLPSNVANDLVKQGVVTITTPADNS